MKYGFLTSILLLTLCGLVSAAPLDESEEKQARHLFAVLGCRACHDFEQRNSNLAGSLDRIGLKLTEAKILERLQLPPEKLGTGEQFMPSYQKTPIEQLKLLSRFLAERK